MQVTETLSEGLKREYKIVVTADAIEDRMTGRLTELSKEIKMPGFRPGKVPVTLLRKTYGKQVLGEILEQVVNESTTQALTEQDVQPALQPKIEITQFEEDSDLEYTVEVEVMPAITPMDFSKLKLEKFVTDVPDEDVDKRVEMMSEQFRDFQEVEDETYKAEVGDVVQIDFKGSVDGEEFEGGTGEDFDLKLGSGQFIPGFEEQLYGHQKGSETIVKVAFPEDYQADHLAGKEAEFAVTVKLIKTAGDTKIDDSLAEKLGLENLEALRNAIKEQTEGEYGQYSRARLKRVLLDQLDDHHTFDVPAGMVDVEFEQIWEQLLKDLEEKKQTLESMDKSEEEAREEYRILAERRVRLGLLLSEVGRTSELDVSAEEVNRAIMEQARQFPGQEQQVFEFFQSNPEAQAQIRAPLLEDKVVDFIVEMADVKETKVSLEDLMRDPDDEGDEETAKEEEKQPAKKKAAAKKKAPAKKKAAKAKKEDDAKGEDGE